MLVHLGRGVAIHGENILTLTDMQRGLTPDTQTLVEQMRRRELVRTLGPEPKTLVVCRQGEHSMCYLSCVGLRTLRARLEGRQLIETREVQHG